MINNQRTLAIVIYIVKVQLFFEQTKYFEITRTMIKHYNKKNARNKQKNYIFAWLKNIKIDKSWKQK
jgi:hypothetical protein